MVWLSGTSVLDAVIADLAGVLSGATFVHCCLGVTFLLCRLSLTWVVPHGRRTQHCVTESLNESIVSISCLATFVFRIFYGSPKMELQ